MLFPLFPVAPAAAASVVTSIVTDPLTGVAIDGWDPVSYFSEPAPLRGSPEFVHSWGGVPWYFATAANRDVFLRAPHIYAPQYGGHCTMSLARGYISDGRPRIYVLAKMKLYLFHSTANREAFLLNPAAALRGAEDNWSKLAQRLIWPEDEDGGNTRPAIGDSN